MVCSKRISLAEMFTDEDYEAFENGICPDCWNNSYETDINKEKNQDDRIPGKSIV
jgi:hypothetical protein